MSEFPALLETGKKDCCTNNELPYLYLLNLAIFTICGVTSLLKLDWGGGWGGYNQAGSMKCQRKIWWGFYQNL